MSGLAPCPQIAPTQDNWSASMRVLLINSNRKGDMLAAAPIGLCYVASAVEAAGHSVNVLDLCFSRKNGVHRG